MNLHVLEDTLRHLGLPMVLVSLGRETDSTWSLVPVTDQHWEVYWSVGGTKHSLAVLGSEADACYYLLGKLVHDQVLAGQFELPS